MVGTYDRRLLWFDLDLSTKPYQSLRHHGQGIRAVAYHKRYPLFASGSDDLSAIVCHGMVYKYVLLVSVLLVVVLLFHCINVFSTVSSRLSDLLQNPTIVPLKMLRGHQRTDDFGLLDVLFHPTQPWLFTSGADATIRLYT